MNWPVILGILAVAFSLVALIGLLWALRDWHSFGRTVNDLAVKIVAFLIKTFGIVVSIRGAYAVGEDKDEWYFPAVAGGVCAAVWELLDKIVEYRVKAVEKLDKQALADAKNAIADAEARRAQEVAFARGQSERLAALLSVLRQSVMDKTKRLIAKMNERKPEPSAKLVRAALTPDAHLDELVQSIAAFAAEQVPKDHGEIVNFRVGLYAERGGVMTPLSQVDLNDRRPSVFRSYQLYESAFRLDAGEDGSLVVACANRGKTMIVEDCIVAAAEGKFRLYSENQRSYLRSMLAFYLGTVYCDDGKAAVAVIALDTDSPGFFRESDRGTLEFWLREFGARVKLELLLHSMLVTRGATK